MVPRYPPDDVIEGSYSRLPRSWRRYSSAGECCRRLYLCCGSFSSLTGSVSFGSRELRRCNDSETSVRSCLSPQFLLPNSQDCRCERRNGTLNKPVENTFQVVTRLKSDEKRPGTLGASSWRLRSVVLALLSANQMNRSCELGGTLHSDYLQWKRILWRFVW